MSQNIRFGDEIFTLQSHGGISTIWRALSRLLPDIMPECTFDPSLPADIYLPSYYSAAPDGVKSVVLVYDFIMRRYPGFPRFNDDMRWQQAAIARADAVIAISQWTAGDVKAFTGKTASVAYPATSLERADYEDIQTFKAKYHLPDNYVLIVGRRDLYKNVQTYEQARALLLPNIPFTLYVGGEQNGAVYAHAGLVGWQIKLPAEDLPAAYTGALCLVYPSLYEGFGLPVLEAYACGCPVICGGGGGLAEINGAAFVVDVTRPREIAEAIMKMQDPGVRIEHILAGYEVVKQFTWENMAERVAAVIREVAEREAV